MVGLSERLSDTERVFRGFNQVIVEPEFHIDISRSTDSAGNVIGALDFVSEVFGYGDGTCGWRTKRSC
ncbi:hypothetical protein Pcinc_024870 [Petrolisthes cinctipes]|uniref:Uncharacterized protein n=1 Tax=Petrolisthes cinctipes TaxID=88211 RepID=A0AAE1FA15_PETCI|nr:hypothetical protein Pcinc_024870 [Petrolisthes cinctipes]